MDVRVRNGAHLENKEYVIGEGADVSILVGQRLNFGDLALELRIFRTNPSK